MHRRDSDRHSTIINMPEPVSTTAALIGIFKSIREGLRALRESNLSNKHKQAVEDVSDLLIDAQDRLSDIQAESVQLREENAELRRQMAENDQWSKLFRDYNLVTTPGGAVVYQKTYMESRRIIAGRKGGDPEHKDHYVCPSCVNEQQLQVLQPLGGYSPLATCPGCQVNYKIIPTPEVPGLEPYNPLDRI